MVSGGQEFTVPPPFASLCIIIPISLHSAGQVPEVPALMVSRIPGPVWSEEVKREVQTEAQQEVEGRRRTQR